MTTVATDAVCRPTTTTLPSPYGVVSTLSYANLGNPATQKSRVETPGPDGSPSWTESYFDGFGRTYRAMKRGPSSAAIVTDVQFNERGGLDAQTAPYYAGDTAKIRTFNYDWFDRPTVTTLPDGKTRTTGYPALSSDSFFQVTSTNELGQSSTTKFDVFGRARKSEKSTSLHGLLVTTTNYDILGRTTSVVDPIGTTWSYTYDSLGRNLSKVDPDAGTWTYAYDDAGRLTSQLDAKSQATTFEYDSVGRPQYKRIRPTGGIGGTIAETVETTYGTSASLFNKGRVTQLVTKNGGGTELSGKMAFEYDVLGRAIKQTRTLDGTSYVTEQDYNSAGYLRGLKYPDNDTIGQFGGSGTALGYDGAGRLSSIPGILTSTTYNALGAPLVQANENGTTTTKTYDANRFWLKTIGTTGPSATLQNLAYTLNDAGMATGVTSPVANESWTYEYDELNRLKTSTNGVSGNDQTWTYDSLGRFATNSKVGTTFTYPGVGSARPHAPTAISGGPLGSLSFSYDANGNMLSGNGRAMTWNADNLITQVAANSTTTSFTYGPGGDRIQKAQGSNAIKYPFGDDYEIAANGTVTKYFSADFGPIAKKVGSGSGGTLYWLHTDRMGSINATTDGTGAEVLRRAYRSYGELLGQTGTHAESLGYIGQRTDEETANGVTGDKGLTYLHARYQDPALGIFLSPDPLAADFHTYRYGFGDPVNMSDRSGLVAEAGYCQGGLVWVTDPTYNGAHEVETCPWWIPGGGGAGAGGTGGTGGSGQNCSVDYWDPSCGNSEPEPQNPIPTTPTPSATPTPTPPAAPTPIPGAPATTNTGLTAGFVNGVVRGGNVNIPIALIAKGMTTKNITFNGNQTKFEKAIVDPLRPRGSGSYPVTTLGQVDFGGRVGRHSVNVSGTLTITSGGDWGFAGTISSATGRDPYNYNPSNRSLLPETAVAFGRGLTYFGLSQDYLQGISGVAGISGSGH